MNNKIHIINEDEDPDLFIEGGNSFSFSEKFSDPNFNDSGLIIDKAAFNVYLKGDKVSFPKKEFELLLLLASNPRKVFKREEILLHIWGRDFKQKDSRSLDVHIRMLRKKLNDDFITTVRGVGYKLEK